MAAGESSTVCHFGGLCGSKCVHCDPEQEQRASGFYGKLHLQAFPQ